MHSIRVASLCFVVALALAPLPARAQGPGNNLNAINARVAALEAAVDKLKGNIAATDLAGTYAFYLIGIAMDGPGTVATHNHMSSYVATGTVTLIATTATSGTGTLNGIFDGVGVNEQLPGPWAWFAASGAQSANLTWTYDSGTRTLSVDTDAFNDFDLSVAAGGQVLVSVVDRDGTTIVLGRVSGDFPGSPGGTGAHLHASGRQDRIPRDSLKAAWLFGCVEDWSSNLPATQP